RSARARHFCATASSVWTGSRADMGEPQAVARRDLVGRVVNGTRKQRRTDTGLCKDGTPESRENHNPFRAGTRGKGVGDPLRMGKAWRRRDAGGPKTEPPGRGKPGGSR